jgi:predicted Zn-dependent peptidase
MLESPSFEVFYVGERPIDEVAGYVGEVLGKRSSGATISYNGDSRMLGQTEKHQEISESKEISQSRLAMSFSCGVNIHHKDYYSMLLLNEILGASPISKLMMNVREAMGLCYECSSAYDASYGALFVYSGVEASELAVARGAIIGQIEAIAQGDVSEKELSAAKKSIINVYNGITDSPSAIERFYLGGIMNGANDSIEDAISKISSLSVSDVARVARGLSLHTSYSLVGTLCAGEGENE